MAQVQYKSETLIKGNKRTKTSRLDSSESDDVYCNRFPFKKKQILCRISRMRWPVGDDDAARRARNRPKWFRKTPPTGSFVQLIPDLSTLVANLELQLDTPSTTRPEN